MADELAALGAHGATAAGTLLAGGGLVRWLLGRQVEQFDGALKSLATTNDTLAKAVDELKKEIGHLRETNVGFSEKLGALASKVEGLEGRVNGMGQSWQQKHDALEVYLRESTIYRPERPRRR